MYFNEQSQHLCLNVNHRGFKALLKNLVVTDGLDIYACDSFKPSLRKSLNLTILRFKKLELVGCNINKDDLAYFLHPLVVEFQTENVTVRPNLQFQELLEMLKNVEILRFVFFR